jgi:hypothetical protein
VSGDHNQYQKDQFPDTTKMIDEYEEPMTQQEWDEHHKQLEKHLAGVEKRYIARLGVAMGFERQWVGLTDEERYLNEARSEEEIEYAKAIEAKLKEKNAYGWQSVSNPTEYLDELRGGEDT